MCAPEEKRFCSANRLKSHLRQVHAAAAAASAHSTTGRSRSPTNSGTSFQPNKGAESISISQEITIDGQETTVVEVSIVRQVFSDHEHECPSRFPQTTK